MASVWPWLAAAIAGLPFAAVSGWVCRRLQVRPVWHCAIVGGAGFAVFAWVIPGWCRPRWVRADA